MVLHKVHIIGQVTELHIYVKSLGKQVHRHTVMTLKLEPVTHISAEIFIITVIPDHTYLINKKNGFLRQIITANVGYVKGSTAGNVNGAVNQTSLLQIVLGQLCDESGLARAFLAEDHDKLVGVQELTGINHKGSRKREQGKNQVMIPTHRLTS